MGLGRLGIVQGVYPIQNATRHIEIAKETIQEEAEVKRPVLVGIRALRPG